LWPSSGTCTFCGQGAWEPVPVEAREQGYGLWACGRCRGYLKVVDGSGRAGEIDLFWEDLNTVDLDLAAWKLGLISGAVLAALKAREKGANGAGPDVQTRRGPAEDGASRP
jgi:hypothetical protein